MQRTAVPAPQGPVDSDTTLQDFEDDDHSDTLKTSASAPVIPNQTSKGTLSGDLTPSTPLRAQATGPARLSGLFHGWLDAHQHPAPPPSPQLTLVSTERGHDAEAEGHLVDDAREVEIGGRRLSVSSPIGQVKGSLILDAERRQSQETTRSLSDQEEPDFEIDRREWERFLVSSA